MTSAPTTTQTLASTLLGTDVVDWVKERRSDHHYGRRPWALIADELKEATDNKVAVSGESLRLWAMAPASEAN